MVNNLELPHTEEYEYILDNLSSPRSSRSLPTSPSSVAAPASPQYPTSNKSRLAQGDPSSRPRAQHTNQTPNQSHLFNQHTHQRIQDALQLIGHPVDATASTKRRFRPNSTATTNSTRNREPLHVQTASPKGDWDLGHNKEQLSPSQIQKLVPSAVCNHFYLLLVAVVHEHPQHLPHTASGQDHRLGGSGKDPSRITMYIIVH